eukprot:scaffold19212_cov67-Cylindrotheca_fusiformis.AAC.1
MRRYQCATEILSSSCHDTRIEYSEPPLRNGTLNDRKEIRRRHVTIKKSGKERGRQDRATSTTCESVISTSLRGGGGLS